MRAHNRNFVCRKPNKQTSEEIDHSSHSKLNENSQINTETKYPKKSNRKIESNTNIIDKDMDLDEIENQLEFPALYKCKDIMEESMYKLVVESDSIQESKYLKYDTVSPWLKQKKKNQQDKLSQLNVNQRSNQEGIQFHSKLLYNPTFEFPFVYSSDSVIQQNITAVAWTDENVKNPYTFKTFSLNLVEKVQKEGFLFCRKFTPDSVTLEEWERLVLKSSSARETIINVCNTNTTSLNNTNNNISTSTSTSNTTIKNNHNNNITPPPRPPTTTTTTMEANVQEQNEKPNIERKRRNLKPLKKRKNL